MNKKNKEFAKEIFSQMTDEEKEKFSVESWKEGIDNQIAYSDNPEQYNANEILDYLEMLLLIEDL